MNKYFLLVVLTVILLACNCPKAEINEFVSTFPTYSFSDPDAIPRPDMNFYPYFRFDGYSHQADSVKWKVVELENKYIKVSIFPEIGGKIWGAIEKSTGNEFIYSNSVVKFRNISMRGPWTSGGIEFNFGTIGHVPTTATPVDYTIKKIADGSVSCFVGSFDFQTRTRWETEINLHPGKAFFTTNIKWYNSTLFTQPYYQWCNAAFQASGNLEMIFPGDYRVGHEGDVAPWPIDESNRDLSFYDNNNFGDSKSYHITGSNAGSFVAYWHDLNFGSGNYSSYGDKLGRKIFLWSQARDGGIWEDLLTDTDGQYVEMQTGRLFNQTAGQSIQTPYKYRGFHPGSNDEFLEYWFPVMNIGGMVKANASGILNVKQESTAVKILFSPLQIISSKMHVYSGEKLIHSFDLNLKPLEKWETEIAKVSEPLKIIIGENELVYSEKDPDITSRPVNPPANFDWNSIYGHYINGINNIYQGFFNQAFEDFTACLNIDPLYAPALNKVAELYLRKSDAKNALFYIKRSLSIDTYDPQANYLLGIANRLSGNPADAQDGFAVAALSYEYRIPAYIEMTKLFISKNEMVTAQQYVERILTKERENQEALLLQSIILRKSGGAKKAREYADKLEDISPLNHFARFEKMMIRNNAETYGNFSSMIRNELPHETYAEMAYWYLNAGCKDEAVRLFEMSPKNPLIDVELAYLSQDNTLAQQYLEQMLKAPVDFVFPFRYELLPSLESAMSKTGNWKPCYYLALLHWRLGNKEMAKELFEKCKTTPESPYFYLAKAELFKDQEGYNPEQDLIKSLEVGNKDWRTSRALINHYLAYSKIDKALTLAEESQAKFPGNEYIKFCYVRALLANGDYKKTLDELENTVIFPHEGASDGRTVYKQASILEGLQFIKDNEFEKALASIEKARLWPENLGVGRPYEVDERMEDFLEALCYGHLKNFEKAQIFYEKVIATTKFQKGREYRANDLFYFASMKRLNRPIGWPTSTDPVLIWIKAALNGVVNPVKKQQTEGAPWAPVHSDPDMDIVAQIAQSLFSQKPW